MPSVNPKTEKIPAAETSDSLRQAIVIIEHKIRNLEKRKVCYLIGYCRCWALKSGLTFCMNKEAAIFFGQHVHFFPNFCVKYTQEQRSAITNRKLSIF